MAKKSKPTLREHLAEKQRIETRLEEIRFELDSFEISTGSVGKMSLKVGEAGSRFESFKLNHSKNGIVQKEYRDECDRLESIFKTVKEKCLAANDKRDRLKAEQEELKLRLSEMSYPLAKGELANILQNCQSIESQKAALLKTILEHEKRKKIIQENIDNGENAINGLMAKRQEFLADQAMGTNDVSASIDSLDLEINELIASQLTKQQSLDNAEDMIAGLNTLVEKTEQKAKTLRAETQEAVCHYLVDRAEIAGEKYSKAAAQLGQSFAEFQALADILESVSDGSFPRKLVIYDAYRLFVPAVLAGSKSRVQLAGGLLSFDQINIPSLVQAEKENLKKMGFVW